jgi:hypothetical protein
MGEVKAGRGGIDGVGLLKDTQPRVIDTYILGTRTRYFYLSGRRSG